MSMINYASREINCKLVYYGPGLGGKTTNLEHVYGKVAPDQRGKMVSLAGILNGRVQGDDGEAYQSQRDWHGQPSST